MIIYGHNTGKQINQLAFRVNFVEAPFEQFVNTEYKVSGRCAAENIISRLRVRHFMHKFPPLEKINTTEVCYAPNMDGGKIHGFAIYSDIRLCLEECFEAYHTKLNF
jgi:hypothetical protein